MVKACAQDVLVKVTYLRVNRIDFKMCLRRKNQKFHKSNIIFIIFTVLLYVLIKRRSVLLNFSEFEFSEIEKSSGLLEDGVFLEQLRYDRINSKNVEISQVYGNPIDDAEVWSELSSDCDDGIMCGKYVSDLLNENKLSEDDIRYYAYKCGEFEEDYGSTRNGIVNFIENIGLEASAEYNLSIKDICESLDNNEKVICEISSILLCYPEMYDFPGLSADRFVQVIGIDETNSDDRHIIVNDPFELCGGTKINIDDFFPAWSKSGFYAVFAK